MAPLPHGGRAPRARRPGARTAVRLALAHNSLVRRPLPYLLALMLAAAAFQSFRPLPVTAATSVVPAVEHVGTAPALPWPAQGEAALLVDGLGEVGSSGGRSPAPMASTAKMMTALIVLEDHPLGLDEPGPTITVTRADVNTFYAQRSQVESVLPVVVG